MTFEQLMSQLAAILGADLQDGVLYLSGYRLVLVNFYLEDYFELLPVADNEDVLPAIDIPFFALQHDRRKILECVGTRLAAYEAAREGNLEQVALLNYSLMNFTWK